MNNILEKFLRFNIINKIIILIVGCFILPAFVNVFMFLFKFSEYDFYNYFELSSSLYSFIYKPWTIITYGFIHKGFFHLFYNLLLLYYFGNMMLNLFDKKLIINTFFIGIIFGGLAFLFAYNLFPVFSELNISMVGSSAGVMAILIFISSYSPESKFPVFIFSVPIKYIAIFFVLLDIVQIPVSNSGGHIAHLGGATWGYFYQKQYLKGNDIGSWFTNFIYSIPKVFNKSSKIKIVKKDKSFKDNFDQKKVDEILDKIANSGYESLTKEEKKYLFKIGKK